MGCLETPPVRLTSERAHQIRKVAANSRRLERSVGNAMS
jgi:hypothetical protein